MLGKPPLGMPPKLGTTPEVCPDREGLAAALPDKPFRAVALFTGTISPPSLPAWQQVQASSPRHFALRCELPILRQHLPRSEGRLQQREGKEKPNPPFSPDPSK